MRTPTTYESVNPKALASYLTGVAQEFNGLIDSIPKIYRATISQTGTNDPVVTVLENTIGPIVWTRNIAGNYHGTLTGAFPSSKVLTLCGNGSDCILRFYRFTDNIVIISTIGLPALVDGTSIPWAIGDGLLLDTSIEILVY